MSTNPTTYADRHPNATPEQIAAHAAALLAARSGADTAARMDKAHALAVRTGAVAPATTSLGWLA